MKADGEKIPAPAGSRSAAQLAAAHHGRTAAAMAAATPLEEEYPVQRAAITGQRLTSAHSRRVAQLQAWVQRRAAPEDEA
jgi:hypothetical protein